MNRNFPAAVGFVLDKEGGFVDDPQDPGGATNWGISKRAHPNEDIKGMTRDRAATIYRRTYWDAVHGDDLPAGVDLVLLDMAVNAGPKAAIKLAQRAVRETADGQLGPVTLWAIRAAKPVPLINAISDARLSFYRSLPGWARYGKGWSARVEACRALALSMAAADATALASSPVAASGAAFPVVKPTAKPVVVAGTAAGAQQPIAHAEYPERPGWLARLFAALAATFTKRT